jgi:predicted DNA binding CopG/RHH family protein
MYETKIAEVAKVYKKDSQINLRLMDSQIVKLDKIANKRGLSRSALIRHIADGRIELNN